MRGAFVETLEEGASGGRHDRLFVVLARKLPHGCERIERHHGDEFDLVGQPAAEQLNAAEACDLPVANPNEDLLLEEPPICRRVLVRCPTMPDPDDHLGASGQY